MDKIKSTVLQALIITKNEEPNISRVLERLTWLERVVVLDSYSTDQTVDIVQSFPNVDLHYRAFDSFANQWNYGLSLINSEWVLNLDADYVLTEEFIQETKFLISNNDLSVNAYNSKFKFLIYGRKLISNNTTPRQVLFRRVKGSFFDDGHTQRLTIKGETGRFTNFIHHDDRKSLSRWLENQDSYSIKECIKLLDPENPNSRTTLNRIRRTKILAPFLVFVYCVCYRGLLFNGWAGWYYILQRTMVEMLWALRMIEAENFKIKFPESPKLKKVLDYECTEDLQ